MGVAQLPIPTRVTSTPPPVATERGDGLVRWGKGREMGGGRGHADPLHPHPHPRLGFVGLLPRAPSLGQDTALESSLSAFPGSGVCNILQQLFNISLPSY